MRTPLLVGLAILSMSRAALAGDPLSMSATTTGSALELTFANVSAAPVTMRTHVRAGRDHHDDLTVRLTGAQTRTLRFTEARDKSVPVDATLAPGGRLVRRVDLAAWAVRAGNTGGPLAPGAYDVEAVWDATAPKVRLVATAKLVIAAPVETSCTDTASTGLELIATQVRARGPVEVGVHNVDTVAHCVVGYVKAHELQSDWLVFDLHAASAKKPRRIALDDSRRKSHRVTFELAPGATVWTTWDLDAWARRKRNGAAPIARDTHWAEASYDTTRETDVWRGKIGDTLGVTY
ncbi:MAG: hypothetical protein KF773_37155 [Deltaproteobacteria bacterium]|nr:hypothetical protein [Deltaproteobacteria bacterium]